MQHASDDRLERYAMQTLPDSESRPLEEHLVMCQSCRERLDETEQYVAAMRSAAAKIEDNGKGE